MRLEQPHHGVTIPRAGSRKRILIVCANESNRERLEECLSSEYDVLSLTSPANREAAIQRLRPHLVIEQLDDAGRSGDATRAPGNAAGEDGAYEGLVGSCDAMRAVFSLMRSVARTDVAVLLVGECGTGKEATARAIHRLSARRTKPFVTLNAGALPLERLEAEVFGRENGGSGALPGAIEQADGGTLFLAGAGRIPAGFQ